MQSWRYYFRVARYPPRIGWKWHGSDFPEPDFLARVSSENAAIGQDQIALLVQPMAVCCAKSGFTKIESVGQFRAGRFTSPRFDGDPPCI